MFNLIGYDGEVKHDKVLQGKDIYKFGLGSEMEECLNALLIDFNKSGGHSLLNSLENPKTTDAPIKMIALRTEYQLTIAHYAVMLIEIYPVPSRIWINTYNTNAWTGWKSVTLT